MTDNEHPDGRLNGHHNGRQNGGRVDGPSKRTTVLDSPRPGLQSGLQSGLHPGDERHFGWLATDVARLMRTVFDRRVRTLGLTRPQWLALVRLKRRPGVSQSELADMMEIEKAPAGSFQRGRTRMRRLFWGALLRYGGAACTSAIARFG